MSLVQTCSTGTAAEYLGRESLALIAAHSVPIHHPALILLQKVGRLWSRHATRDY